MAKDKILVLAAPGVGKSYVAKHYPNYHDFDIGVIRHNLFKHIDDFDENWRRAKDFYPALYESLNLSYKYADVIMINEPAFAEYCKERNNSFIIYTCIPGIPEDWLYRVQLRDGDSEFAITMADNYQKWYPGWVDTGEKLGTIIYIEQYKFLSDYVELIL